jgi:hypothetical protein
VPTRRSSGCPSRVAHLLNVAHIALLVACAGAGCTHLTPYYRGGQPWTVEPAGESRIDHRLLLIGDAGDANPNGEPALQTLSEQVRLLPDRTTVVFLGDNIYERGMPEAGASEPAEAAAKTANVLLSNVFDSRKEAERSLDAQIDTVRGTRAPAIFIPGNHDWDPFGADGWKRILAQGNYLQAAANSGAGVDVTMLPKGGCPGPVSVPLGKLGMLVVLDTQWWLERGTNGRPQPENNPTHCGETTEAEIVAALVSELETAARQRRWAIVVGHHPLNSYGPHGGFVEGYTHLFPMRFLRHYVPFYLEWLPMPVLGTAAVLARQHFSPSAQDASNALNEHLRSKLRGAMAEAESRGAPTLAYAGGHDHSLQVFRTAVGPRFTLVSGLGATSRASEVGDSNNTLFAHANPLHPGFMQLDFLHDGSVRLSVIEAQERNAKTGTDAGLPIAAATASLELAGGKKEVHPVEVFSTMIADADSPRGARPKSKSRSLWHRMRQRAASVWNGGSGKDSP